MSVLSRQFLFFFFAWENLQKKKKKKKKSWKSGAARAAPAAPRATALWSMKQKKRFKRPFRYLPHGYDWDRVRHSTKHPRVSYSVSIEKEELWYTTLAKKNWDSRESWCRKEHRSMCSVMSAGHKIAFSGRAMGADHSWSTVVTHDRTASYQRHDSWLSQFFFFLARVVVAAYCVQEWYALLFKGEVRTINDRNISERRNWMKNNGKSPTFIFVSGEERRRSKVQRVSRNWRLPGATHSSADLTCIRKWLKIQAPELSELESVGLELGRCCSDFDKLVSDEICRTRKRQFEIPFRL